MNKAIVAPSIIFCYSFIWKREFKNIWMELNSKCRHWKRLMGNQPSYHLNEIAIRHWDGYWFGKREMWGDTFPHYWSTLTGAAFYLYAQCVGNNTYKRRAENIVKEQSLPVL